MSFTTEIVEEKQKALIVSKKNYVFINDLKVRLKDSSVEYFFSSRQPESLDRFDYCFFINEPFSPEHIKKYPQKKIIYILLNQKNDFRKLKVKSEHIKTVAVGSDVLTSQDLDKVLWFSFSKTSESHLFINTRHFIKSQPPSIKLKMDFQKYLTTKMFLILFIFFVFIYHLAFIPPLVFSVIHTVFSFNELRKESIEEVDKHVKLGNSYLNISKNLYNYARPTWLLFGVASFPDNAIDLSNKGLTVIKEASSLVEGARGMQALIFAKNKSPEEKADLILRFKKIKDSLTIINEDLAVMNQKFPTGLPILNKAKISMIEAIDLIGKSERMLDYLEGQLFAPQEKKYLVYFANNRELRPGGGFIGSFGVLRIGNYEIQGIQVYDVYDADGQLTVHIDPPVPLSKYLGVPHWFLRDSNFSPDFLENHQEALFFLENEMELKDFEGSILITTSAIENILAAFGDLYIPDYDEYINAKNFYLKTQLYVEKDFFPGSTQKRNFLSSLMNQLFINLDQVSVKTLGREIRRSLDEKQLTVYVKDPSIQALFDSSFWSGRVIEPKCTLSQNCIIDYLFPYDANVGANKANYFVNRSMYLKTDIDNDGQINHLLSIQYKNNSPSLVFPTGLYRNYFQVLLPRESTVKDVTKNGIRVDEIDQKDDKYKTVGFFFEIKPMETAEIKVSYSLNQKVTGDRQIYQFVIQKQIGAPNSDFVLEFTTGKNIYVLNQNFSPVVKGREIIYNTNLSTDKIFLIELMKQ
jgi:chemotaxis receptor (MCP) glutamine deamidase CheD